MLREFVVSFSMRKVLSAEFVKKDIPVGLDDLPEDLTESEIREMAKRQAEQYFIKSEDYPLYGKFWQFLDINNA